MLFARFAIIAASCEIALSGLAAAVVGEDSEECAMHPKDETSRGEHVMLQHSETHRAVNVHGQALHARQDISHEKNSAIAMRSPPKCTCEKIHPTWKPSNRTQGGPGGETCIFIDLGAAGGNTFDAFLNNSYVDVETCTRYGRGSWTAFLVEANPRFNEPLRAQAAKYPPGYVTTLPSTAAYMCDGQTSFFLDTVNGQKDYWGSSMSANHPDVVKSQGQNVTVPTVNILKLIYENVIPDDKVILKMDIEGAEFDILPCLAQSPVANLVDVLYLEKHDPSWGSIGTTAADMDNYINMLKTKNNISIPTYISETL